MNNVDWKQSKGLVIIYVGDGKGKTTAALGAVVRSLGHGWKVYVAQFMKEEKWPSGEREFFRGISPLLVGEGKGKVKIETTGEGFVGIMGDKKARETHKAAAEKGYEKALTLVKNGEYALVVLDEILSAVDEGLLTEQQILDLIAAKPDEVTLLMTGHKSYPAIFAKADVVTEMKKVKHPFDSGFIAKEGIDY